jgi:hypothetical protein
MQAQKLVEISTMQQDMLDGSDDKNLDSKQRR